MKLKGKLLFLSIILLVLAALYLIWGLNPDNLDYALPRRVIKLISILMVGSCIAFSTTVFQTITNNRILTPSVLGLDSLYAFIQTFVVFLLGSTMLANLGGDINFILSAGLMVIFSVVLFKTFFSKEKRTVFSLLLFGVILGTFLQSLTTFMQVLMDPNEFFLVQNRMFASFNNINTDILYIAVLGTMVTLIYIFRYTRELDVVSLGRDSAISLGVDYASFVKRMFIVISILVSISTALVGPISFLGLIVVNINRQFLNTYKHKYLIPGSMLISSIMLLGGQLIAERIMNLKTPISIVINFIGGTYFIYLIFKEGRLS
ncbi:MAG: iron chelate uptake ABC transporter family permease subunit [Tissierellia bacterium]|nr:iron chelate uptake ABC transporter family permease subunit [Tissierellia bacterium]